jgi:hypothetical protein
MANKAIKLYAKENGGRVSILFLLFLLAIYEYYAMGVVGYALVCLIPAMIIGIILAYKHTGTFFWVIFTINYFIMGIARYVNIPIQLSAITLGPQLALLMVMIFNPNRTKGTHYGTPMLIVLLIWTFYLFSQAFNDTCMLPFSMSDWLLNMTFYSFYFLLAYFMVTKLIRDPQRIMTFLRLWAFFSILAGIWAWKQKTFWFDEWEWRWLAAGAIRTHIIGGSIRYFSFFSDAANFGCCIASSAVAFYISAITTPLRKDKLLFLIAALFSTFGMFTSGTRSGIFCFLVGIALYVFLSKSIKIAIPVIILGSLFVSFLAFTKIGDNNILIRRMRTAFNKDDASLNVRDMNKKALKKYLQDAPFGLGMNINEATIPAFHKFRVVYETSNDSTYVFFWQRTGIVGVFFFAGMNIIILAGGCIITFFRLRSRICQGIGGAFCCAFLGINAGGYANHIMLQYPNIILFYGGMAIVYLLPSIQDKFDVWEQELNKRKEERKRIKLENKKKSRVKIYLNWI